MDDANEADAEPDAASPSDDETTLPSPPETNGQLQARDTEQSHKPSNARDLKATGVARAAARLLQQDTPEGGLGILSVRHPDVHATNLFTKEVTWDGTNDSRLCQTFDVDFCFSACFAALHTLLLSTLCN